MYTGRKNTPSTSEKNCGLRCLLHVAFTISIENPVCCEKVLKKVQSLLLKVGQVNLFMLLAIRTLNLPNLLYCSICVSKKLPNMFLYVKNKFYLKLIV